PDVQTLRAYTFTRGHTQARPVQHCSPSLRRNGKLPERRQMNDTELQLPLFCQGKQHSKIIVPVDERLCPIERVNNPDSLPVRELRISGLFFGQDSVSWKE